MRQHVLRLWWIRVTVCSWSALRILIVRRRESVNCTLCRKITCKRIACMASQSGKTCYSIIAAYCDVGFCTLNSSSAGFGISNSMRAEESLKKFPPLRFLRVPLGEDARSVRRHDLIERDNQSHNESLIVARPHCQIEHISSQPYIWSYLLCLHLCNDLV